MDLLPAAQNPDYEARRFTEFVHARFTGATPLGVVKGKIPRKELKTPRPCLKRQNKSPGAWTPPFAGSIFTRRAGTRFLVNSHQPPAQHTTEDLCNYRQNLIFNLETSGGRNVSNAGNPFHRSQPLPPSSPLSRQKICQPPSEREKQGKQQAGITIGHSTRSLKKSVTALCSTFPPAATNGSFGGAQTSASQGCSDNP